MVALPNLPDTLADAAADMADVRVLRTDQDSFEYLFTGAIASADGDPLLAFNHRNGRTSFVRTGDFLGPYRVVGFDLKTNQVYMPSLNATLDEAAGKATLVGPAGEKIVLEQDRPLPCPGRVARLVRLDSGFWWNVREKDVFGLDNKPVFVEEIDADGVMLSADGDLFSIRRMASVEKDGLNRLWAEQKRQQQERQEELALQRQKDKADRADAAAAATAAAAAAASEVSTFTYERGPHVEIRQPSRFFYGYDYRYPDAFAVYPNMRCINGRLVQSSYVLVPTHFRTRYTGTMLTWP